jgi:hypothetical protein
MAPKATKPVFKKSGQKKSTPPKTDSLYKFYSSLYKQNKKSEMATKWMLEHGCFSEKKSATIALCLGVKLLSINK